MGNLNPKQLQIVESFGLGQAVIAGAGCGKTTTLVAKCLALLEKNPKARFCAVSFTEKSVRDLKESLVKGFEAAGLTQSLTSGGAHHWVKTIHGLCASIIQEFPEAAGLQGGERILVEDQASLLWTKSLEVLWTSSENAEISEAIDRLLAVYSRQQLEALFLKLRSLLAFGVEALIQKNFSREEVKDLWFVFQSIHHRYAHSKNRDGVLDFNDLEVFALRALQSAKVQKYFQNRFDLVLVDEFQDTNPIQGQILGLFIRPDFSNLCIVGDPKQSIYRFRDADVSVFQELSEKLPKRHLLDTNYRSRPSIIEFVNEVCAPTFQAVDLPYEPLEAGRVNEGEETRVTRLEIETEEELAQFLKSEQSRGVDLSEFVILVRSVRKEKTQKFLKALDLVHIPFLLGSGGRFYSDPRIQELISFLRGWVSSKNSLSQAAFLRSPWVAVPDQTLLNWNNESKDHYFEHFFEKYTHPIAEALRSFYLNPHRSSAVRPGELLEKLLQIESIDEELILPLVSLWHKSEALSSEGRRFEEIVHYFSEALENEKIEKEIPAPASQGMVRVLTVHSSKGLQFPRVILLDFDGEYKSQSGKADLIWDRKKGVHLFIRDEEGKREAKDAENIAWAELEMKANVAESKRVFYVALTRAQEELILVWKKEVKRAKKTELPDYNPHWSDNWREWVMATRIPELKTFSLDSNHTETPTKEAKKESLRVFDFDPKSYRPRHSPSEWLILNQCELRYRKKYGLIEEDSDSKPRALQTETDLEVETEVASRSEIAEKGERIHAFIETENWEELQKQFKTPEIGADITKKVQEFLRNGPTPEGKIEAFAELGFEVPFTARQALVGMMDRLEICAETKTIRVIDYKFTAKPKKPESLLAHYALQLRLYAWASAKMVDFVPSRIEAFLVHFTETSIEVIEAPENLFIFSDLEIEVDRLFKKALNRGEQATLGDHCRFCEFTQTCPLFMAASQK